ncbi:MAG: class A beta-lactamase-related serine hydrolase, partial [Acidobacteria bacterium]
MRPSGVSAESLGAAGSVLARAASRGVFPGASAEVGDAAGVVWAETVGRLAYDPESPLVQADTIYDLASLTKVIATGTLMMRSVAQGLLALSTPVARLLPGWDTAERAGVRVVDLLAHSSGLPAVRPLYEFGFGRTVFEREILALPLEYQPGTQSIYSDLGFIVLGFVLEDVYGRTLAHEFGSLARRWNREEPLSFGVDPGALSRTAPTQRDEWRGRLLRGEVDDRNASALGGAAGHAGLFGTAGSVGDFARALLGALNGDGADTFGGQELVALFSERRGIPGSSRALAWDTMMPSSSCGARMSRRAFGHTGFTGTSLWIDPEAGLYFVLLT